jgi:hypothetical protein
MTRDSWYVPSTYHRHAMGRVNQEFAWRGEPVESWQQQLRARFVERLGSFPAEKVGLDVRELDRREKDEYTLTKIVFTSEPCADVPCYLLVPRSGSPPYPAMICLQGHNSGMHLSIGEARDEADQESIAGDRDFALRAVDYLQSRSEVDPQRICCMGNSGGGLSTFYAACVEFRIRLAVASCCFCTYADSIMSIYHCADNYIPGILSVAEVGDIAGLIAPRGLLVVAGEKDEIFPVRGVRKAFEKAKGIFAAAGCPENCRLVLGSEGHRFYAEPAWPVILDMLASV